MAQHYSDPNRYKVFLFDVFGFCLASRIVTAANERAARRIARKAWTVKADDTILVEEVA